MAFLALSKIVRAGALAIPFVFLSGCIDSRENSENDGKADNQVNYHTETRSFSSGPELKSLHRCLDSECNEVDIGSYSQIVAWNSREESFETSYFVIEYLVALENQIFALIWNNHSVFIVKICSNGKLDYMAEVHDILDKRISGIDVIQESPFLKFRISTVSVEENGEPKENSRDVLVLMGGGLKSCESPF